MLEWMGKKRLGCFCSRLLDAVSMPSRYPDPLACQVAQRVFAQLVPPPLNVVLFGSRARGEHHGKSDLDLMVLVPDDAVPTGVTRQAYRFAGPAIRELYRGTGNEDMAVDVLRMTPALLERDSRLPGHTARQITLEGIPVDEAQWQHHRRAPDQAPPGRAETLRSITERLVTAYKDLGDMWSIWNSSVGSVESTGFHAQQALGKMLKTYLLALGDPHPPHKHDIEELTERIDSLVPDSHQAAWTGLRKRVMQYNHLAYDLYLSDMAVDHRYLPLSETIDWATLYEQLNRLAEDMVQDMEQKLGWNVTSDPDVQDWRSRLWDTWHPPRS